MLKRRITFKDFDGVERTEDHHFYINKNELLELNLSSVGGLEKTVQRIIDAQDNYEIYNMFKKIVKLAYGEKSADGKHFVKTNKVDGHRLADDFEETEAFTELIVQLMQNPKEAAEFIHAILPEDIQKNSDTEVSA